MLALVACRRTQTTAAPTTSPTQSPSPSPEPQFNVYGSIGLEVFVLERGSPLKDPFEMTIVLIPDSDGDQIRVPVESAGPFSASLEPGSYRVTGLVIESPGLGKEAVELPTLGGRAKNVKFTVPESGCVYVGQVTFFYVRLPKGSFNKQLETLNEVAEGAESAFIFLPSGSMVFFPADPMSQEIDLPPESERPTEAEECAIEKFRFAKR
jgi:hypothetical protein